jgi:hypothetical protein
MPDREPDVIIDDADRFNTDREALESHAYRLPTRLTPEPEDIDQISREHGQEWRRHFGEETGRGL